MAISRILKRHSTSILANLLILSLTWNAYSNGYFGETRKLLDCGGKTEEKPVEVPVDRIPAAAKFVRARKPQKKTRHSHTIVRVL